MQVMRPLVLGVLLLVAVTNACGGAGSPARSTQGPGASGAPTETEEPKTYPSPTKSGPGYGY